MEAADDSRPARGVDRRSAATLLAERGGLELSSASVSALFTKTPAQVKLTTLAALCTALECSPNDLFDVDITPVSPKAKPTTSSRQPPKVARGRSMPPR